MNTTLATSKPATSKPAPKSKPTTAAELDARLAKLPEYSRMVYAALQGMMYAEPMFSDAKVPDVCLRMAGTPTTGNWSTKSEAVRAALGHLIGEGLVWSEAEGWLHTYEHDNQLRSPAPTNEV